MMYLEGKLASCCDAFFPGLTTLLAGCNAATGRLLTGGDDDDAIPPSTISAVETPPTPGGRAYSPGRCCSMDSSRADKAPVPCGLLAG